MKDTKKFYEEPGVEIIVLTSADVLVVSPQNEPEEVHTGEVRI